MELYLDGASTTPVDENVKKLYADLLERSFASTGSLHKNGEEALLVETNARNEIAALLKVNPTEIYFNSGATEGNNYAIKGVAFQYKNRGKTIITTKVEHPSVLECVEQLQKDYGFNAIYLDVDENGVVDLNQLKNSLSNDVILLSVMYVNHEVGSIMPIKEIRKLISSYPKIIFHSDITQAIGKTPVDFSLIDIATMSSHKIHGLKGCGFMYVKNKVTLYPLFNGHPARNALRAGTSNWISNATTALALKNALLNLTKNKQKLIESRDLLISKLSQIDKVIINTNPNVSIANIINFSISGYNPEVVIRALSSKGIYVSSKSACSVSKKSQISATLKAMKKADDLCISSIRVSLIRPLEREEIDYFLDSLKQVLSIIRR